MRRATEKDNRSGFTLVELLVVIAIIAVLLGLAGGAYFRIFGTQEVKRTETVIRQVAKGFDTQWNATIDDVKAEIKIGKAGATQNPSLNSLAGGDNGLANVLYMKMRLRAEFPQTFAEAVSTSYSTYGVPPKTYFTTSLASIPAASYGYSLPQESAILLYLTMTQTRRGATFKAGDLGASSVSTINYANLGVNFNIFVDAWGNPICFERWAGPSTVSRTVGPPNAQGLTTAVLAELSTPPYAPAAGNLDSQDPDGKVYGSANGPSAATTLNLMNANQNFAPVIYSWGADKVMQTTDDLLSFRLMVQGQKGN